MSAASGGGTVDNLLPRPWTIEAQGIVRAANGKAVMWRSVLPQVVRAVNAEPRLLAALRDCARWIETLPDDDIRLGTEMPDKIREILAEYDGEKGGK